MTTTKPIDVWAEAGLDAELDYRMWFRPTGAWEHVRVKTIGKPDEEQKTLDDGTEIRVFAELAIEHLGVDKVWQVSSKLLLGQLRKHVTRVPCDIDVRARGKAPKRTYEVREHVDGATEELREGQGQLMPSKTAWTSPTKQGGRSLGTQET